MVPHDPALACGPRLVYRLAVKLRCTISCGDADTSKGAQLAAGLAVPAPLWQQVGGSGGSCLHSGKDSESQAVTFLPADQQHQA